MDSFFASTPNLQYNIRINFYFTLTVLKKTNVHKFSQFINEYVALQPALELLARLIAIKEMLHMFKSLQLNN